MKKHIFVIGSLFAFGTALLSCNKGGARQAGQEQNPQAIMASVGDQHLLAEELNRLVKPRMAKLDSEIYNIKKDAIGDWVNQTLLENEAKKQGITVEKLLQKTTDGITVGEDEIKAFYARNKDRLGDDFDKAKAQISARLQGGRRQQAVQTLLASLQKSADIKTNLEQPRVKVSVDDDPSQGPKDAPIVLIEFSDFQCPFCKRTRGTIGQLMSTYADKIHYVFRDFPLSFHQDAPLAHQAANCAGDQGKYWEYNKGLWDRQPNLKRDTLLDLAKTLALNADEFTKCIDSGKYKDEIQKDIADGADAGVSGTPAYFINGRFLSGAQPYDAFKEIIDEELAKAKK